MKLEMSTQIRKFRLYAQDVLQNICVKVIVQESFLDYAHILERTTDKNIAEHVLNILEKHDVNIQNCCVQDYDGAIAMSSEKKGAQSYIKQIQPKAELNIFIAENTF